MSIYSNWKVIHNLKIRFVSIHSELNKDHLFGKNCVITGATGGLGREICLELGKKNVNCLLVGRDQSLLFSLKENLKSLNGNIKISHQVADLRNVEEVNRVIKKSREDFSSIDILVNCAGVFPVNPLKNSSLAEFESCMNLNVRAPFLLCKEFSSDMVRNGWGRIINIASSGAYNGLKNTLVYRTSKHALLGLSRVLHNELKEHNVRTFCVSPGPIKTKMGDEIIKHENPNENFETFIDPNEIAKFVVFLISFNNELVVEEVRLNRMKTD